MLDSLHLALRLGIPEVKVNVVVMKRINEDQVLRFVEMTRDLDIYVRFIEYMPFDGNASWRSISADHTCDPRRQQVEV